MRRVGAVLSDYAERSKKRNQSGTDYVLDDKFFRRSGPSPYLGRDVPFAESWPTGRLYFVIPPAKKFCRHMKLKVVDLISNGMGIETKFRSEIFLYAALKVILANMEF